MTTPKSQPKKRRAASKTPPKKMAVRRRISPLPPAPDATPEQTLKVMSALYRIADAASAVTDLQEFYATIHRIIGELMYAENLFVALLDPQTDLIAWTYYVDTVDIQPPHPARSQEQRGVTGWVLRHGKTMSKVDGSFPSAMKRGEVELYGSDSDGIAIPLKSDERTVGVLMVQSYKPQFKYTLQDVQVLDFCARHISIALERARAHEETRQREAELQIVNSVQAGLASKLDMQGIYDLVGDKIREIFDAQVVVIAIYDPVTDTTSWPYLLGPINGVVQRAYPAPGPLRGFSAVAIRTRQPVVVNEDVERRREELGGGLLVASAATPKSLVYVPILTGDRVLGTVSLQNIDREHAFTESDVRLLQTLANSMSVALENARLFNELQTRNAEISEALEQQTATSDILRVIASSPTDVKPVLDVIAKDGKRLCKSDDAVVLLREGDEFLLAAYFGTTPTRPTGDRFEFSARSMAGQAILERRIVHVPDLEKTGDEFAFSKSVQTRHRAFLAVPLLREDVAIGAIFMRRVQPEPYDEKDIQLVKTFADQAVIALENTRLFKELQTRNSEITEALEQQTATSDILRVIASSPTDIQPVLDVIAKESARLSGSNDVTILRLDEFKLVPIAHYGPIPTFTDMDELPGLSRGGVAGRSVIDKTSVHVLDLQLESEEEYPTGVATASRFGYHTTFATPLLREDKAIGAILIRRLEVRPLTEKQIALLETFAAQAAIAIENVRLFNELQTRNREITEALEQQTATSDILRVIASSPTDVQPVLDVIAEESARLSGSGDAKILRVQEGVLKVAAHYGEVPGFTEPEFLPLDRGSVVGKSVIDKTSIHVLDLQLESEEDYPTGVATARRFGIHMAFATPLLREDKAIGAILISRTDTRPLTEKKIALLETFAAQAAIAIENVRLFNELETRNREISEALEQQTATSEILSAIASSPTNIQPVLNVIAENAARVCGAEDAHVYRVDGELLREWAHRGPLPSLEAGETLPLNRESVIGRAIVERRSILIQDVGELERGGYPVSQGLQKRWGYLTALATPLLREGEAIGGIAIRRSELKPFSEKQIALLRTFADQAVIAIENVRLFNELEARNAEISEALERQTATSEILRVMASSPTDVQPVMDVIAEHARRLLNGLLGAVYRVDGNMVDEVAVSNYSREGLEMHERSYPRPLAYDSSLSSRVILDAAVMNTPDMHDPALPELTHRYSDTLGINSVLGVPMLKDGQAIGAISVGRREKGLFPEKQVALLKTFADQAVIAVENVRLFNETKRLLSETEHRAAELQIINSVQQGLASQLDLQAIIDLVGDKVRSIFGTQVVSIALYDRLQDTIERRYEFEKGEQMPLPPRARAYGFRKHVIETRKSLMLNRDITRWEREYGNPTVIGAPPRSVIFVPMVVGEKVTGVISIQNIDHEDAYTEADLRLLETLTNSMSVAIENARLFGETQRLLKETEQRAAELQIINSVQQGLASKLDMQAIYDLVGDKIRDIFHKVDMGIRIFDPETHMIHYPYTYENGKRRTQGTSYLTERGFSAYVYRTRETVVINENMAQALQDYGSHVLPGSQMEKSSVYVPLVVGDQAHGLINLFDMEREQAFSEADVRLLQTLANAMSVALENARLFDETQRLLKETEHRAAELAIITSVQAGLASKLDMQSIYDLVGDKVREIFSADTTYIMSYDPERQTAFSHYYAERGSRLPPQSVPFGQGLYSQVIRTRQPLVIGDAAEGRALGSREVPSPDTQEDLNESGLYVPIMIGDSVRGVVSVQSYKVNAFGESDTRLLSTLANSMSVALENARLFDETQRLLKETEQRAAELQIINSVQQGLASKLDMQAIYDLVGDKIREIFDAQGAGIAIVDRAQELIMIKYLFEDGQLYRDRSFPLGQGLTSIVLETRQPLLLDSEKEWSKYTDRIIYPGAPQDSKSWLTVPILIGGEAIGALNVQNFEREHAFSQSDLRLLQTLASSLGVALENARLFAETQRLLQETERRAAELVTVNMVGTALAGELDLAPLIELVGDQIRNTFRADIVYLALLDEATNTINFPYIYGEKLESMQYGQGLTSKVIQTGKPLLINQELDRRREQLGATSVGKQARSYLGVPIFVGGKAIGVISVQNTTQENVFSENDEHLLNTIAANVGVALHNARLYREARESRAAAEQANKAKSTFLANMSHELRTPLNAIIGFTRIVRRRGEGALPEKQLENLDKVLVSAEHLLSLINTVLDISKIEAGRMDVSAANFDARALIDLCATTTLPLLKPGVALDKDVAPGMPLIHSDQDKVKQIILNLLSNAAKFTRAGKVSIRARVDDQALSVSVNDTGIGIAPDALGRIFEEFQQADTSTTRQYGGTGLGLAISRNLARLLGGDIHVESVPDAGSTFTLVIPVRYGEKVITPQPETTPARPAADDRRRVVLAIDDDPDVIYLLQENLGEAGYHVIGAHSGNQGLELARELKPYAITLDIMMPHKDGWEVLHDLKSDAATRDIPVILLTIIDKKSLGFQLGAVDYVTKPFNGDDILNALRHLTQVNNGVEPRHLLVVDDDPNVIEMVRQLLEGSSYRLQTAADGQAALDAISKAKPDAILLDLLMPHVDGFTVIERLRQAPETASIPVVVLTAKTLTAEEFVRLNESVAKVMQKQGLNAGGLVEELRRALEKYSQ